MSVRESDGANGGVSEQTQIALAASVVNGMDNEQTNTDRDFKKASQLSRKWRMAAFAPGRGTI